MNCRIENAQSFLADATKTWLELEELPDRLDLHLSIQNIEKIITDAEEETKGLGALARMKRKMKIKKLQQEAQRLHEKKIKFNNKLWPCQEKITELVDVVEKKIKEFTRSKGVIDSTEDHMITHVMVVVAQYCVKTMNAKVA